MIAELDIEVAQVRFHASIEVSSGAIQKGIHFGYRTSSFEAHIFPRPES